MIILIGFAAAAIFTLVLWRSGGSLTRAAGSFVLFGALALLGIWALGQPWMAETIKTIVRLRDDLGGSDPRLAIWGAIMIGALSLVVKIK